MHTNTNSPYLLNQIKFIRFAVILGLVTTVSLSFAQTAAWSDCGMEVDFLGRVQTKTSAVDDKEFKHLSMQFSISPGIIQSAVCVPKGAKNAAQLKVVTEEFIGDKRFDVVGLQAINSATGPILNKKSTFRTEGGVLMRVESYCRGMEKNVACLIATGAEENFPRKIVDNFFQSLKISKISKTPSFTTPSDAINSSNNQSMRDLYAAIGQESKDLGRNQAWGSCVNPLMATMQDGHNEGRRIKSIKKLSEKPSQFGIKYHLLIERNMPSENDIFQCEVSVDGDYIRGQRFN
jgi:hypothetical protein